MPQRITSRLFARSALSPEGPNADGVGGQSNVLDFSLGGLEGIEIIAVTGYLGDFTDSSIGAADNALQSGAQGRQSLHLESGALEDAGNGQIAEDEDVIDSEIFWKQHFSPHWIHTGVAAEGQGLSFSITPNGRIDFTDRGGSGIFTARNITHSAETETNNSDAWMGILLEYHRVLFSRSEIGFLLARRS